MENSQLPCNSVLFQYIDDLLAASKTKEGSKLDTIVLLNHLADNGYKSSVTKMQYCNNVLIYLGHHIKKRTRKVSNKCVITIQKKDIPSTQKEVRIFLGIVGYCVIIGF